MNVSARAAWWGGSATRVAGGMPAARVNSLVSCASEITGQLCLSVLTVTTHVRHLYGKLGIHRHHEAVKRAHTFGLLASTRTP
jgi:hypothetical protein